MATDSSSSSAVPTPASRWSGPSSSLSPLGTTQIRTPDFSEEDEEAMDYRPTRRLPRTLSDHCRIYLEDQLFVHALELANSLLTSGPPHRDGKPAPASILPPVQLGFINNLIIHPKHTSRPDTPERREVAVLALTYLENLFHAAGPVNANLSAAFRFNPDYTPPRARARCNANSSDDDDYSEAGNLGAEGENARIASKLGCEESVWNCGRYFWPVVGWAFNCSVVHPARWEWWRAWMDFMVRVLEEDWRERVASDTAAYERSDAGGEFPLGMTGNSLLAAYCTQRGGRSNGVKWIIKALFADGNQTSLSLFTEVFPSETKGLPRAQNKRKRDMKLDLDNFVYGDYGDTDDELEESSPDGDDMSPPPHPSRAAQKSSPMTLTDFDHYTKNAEAIHMLIPFRMRIMSLLYQIAYLMPQAFTDHFALSEEFSMAMKELPVALFSAMLGTSSREMLGAEYYALLLTELLNFFLPVKAADPIKVDREAAEQGRISEKILRLCYLPHAASTASMEDNAKLSLLLERAAMMLFEDDQLHASADLTEAVTRGVDARKKKAKLKPQSRRGPAGNSSLLAQTALEESSQTLLRIVEAL